MSTMRYSKNFKNDYGASMNDNLKLEKYQIFKNDYCTPWSVFWPLGMITRPIEIPTGPPRNDYQAFIKVTTRSLDMYIGCDSQIFKNNHWAPTNITMPLEMFTGHLVVTSRHL